MIYMKLEVVDGRIDCYLTTEYFHPRYHLDPRVAVQEYLDRCERVQTRNPDMTGAQVHDLVLDQWYRQEAAARARGSRTGAAAVK